MSQLPANSTQLPLIVIGAGGHAGVLLDLIEQAGLPVLYITDHDPHRHGGTLGRYRIEGGDDLVLNHDPAAVVLVNAVGSTAAPFARQKLFERFSARGYRFQTLVHPAAVVSPGAVVEEGAQIMAGAIVQTGATIGVDSIINTMASVDHGCQIGQHVHIAPGARLSGNIRLGSASHVGVGATIIQGVEIGEGATIGAGAVVVRNVGARQTVVGVPAKPIERREKRASTQMAGVMLSAAGRRVALLRHLQDSMHELGLAPRVLATDLSNYSSAMRTADASEVVPPYRDPNCLEVMLDICRRHHVKLIVPTLDPELPWYAERRGAFAAIGCSVAVSAPETVAIGNDKIKTHTFLNAHQFPTARQWLLQELLDTAAAPEFPLLIKPVGGASSIGISIAHRREDLTARAHESDLLVQTIAKGNEYTVDVFVDKHGQCRCAVPRRRLETRGGEVSKGVTVRVQPVIDLACRIAQALPGAYGVLNIQIFYDETTGELCVIEINPRFGGGYPLTHRAGAPMARWVIEDALGLPSTASHDKWRDQLVMLRFDDAVFADASELGEFHK